MILVDDREGSAELAPLLTSPHLVCRLEYGDFAWSGNGPGGPVDVAVERKSLLDLLQSMTSGRLSGHQLIGLTQRYDHVYLLVEGVWRADRHTGVLHRIDRKGRWVPAAQGSRRFMARDVWNYLTTLQVACGVYVVSTSSTWETGWWVDSTFRWWSKPWGKHKSHLQWQRHTEHAHLAKPNLVARCASQFDGIGWDRARALGARYPLLEDFLGASAEDLQEVDGIGPKLAESIVRQRNE